MPSLPYACVDLKGILGKVPSFMGEGLVHENERLSLDCTERSDQGQYELFLNGHFVWKISTEKCDLEAKKIPLKLLLAVQRRLKVRFSDNTPLSEWPGVEGIAECDGNYISVLFLAWSYILSAKWAELLSKSPEHECKSKLTAQIWHHTSSNEQDVVEIDLGDTVDEEEANWWNAIFSPSEGWTITTDYNGKIYQSPWSVSVIDKHRFRSTETVSSVNSRAPSSNTALTYLSRFCAYHGLYGQCSAALSAALFIPVVSGGSVSLPIPRKARTMTRTSGRCSDMISEHKNHLSSYMTISCNVSDLYPLLGCTFFNAQIECNLVSAWLNPAFSLIDPLVKGGNYPKLAKVLAFHKPQLAALWLGAILMGEAKSCYYDAKLGLVAGDLQATAWMGIPQSFITLKPDICNEEAIRREDECRLLFMVSSDKIHGRVPSEPWKPFGETRLYDTDIDVRQHVKCGHFLDYSYWHWGCTNDKEVNDPGLHRISAQNPPDRPLGISSSNDRSRNATRRIFGWLRSSGYPACEKPIYEHSWIVMSSYDEKIEEDDDSDVIEKINISKARVEEWLRSNSN